MTLTRAGIKTFPNPNVNGRPLVDCPGCGKRTEHDAKGYCNNCYRRLIWKRKLIKCKSCGRMRPHKAFGMCDGCHTRIYHLDKIRKYNTKKYHNLGLEVLDKATKECACCGFDKLITLHHLDGDRKNGGEKNLVGLCPNCHKMIHTYQYFEEVKGVLNKKGFDTEKVHPSNYVFRRDEQESKK